MSGPLGAQSNRGSCRRISSACAAGVPGTGARSTHAPFGSSSKTDPSSHTTKRRLPTTAAAIGFRAIVIASRRIVEVAPRQTCRHRGARASPNAGLTSEGRGAGAARRIWRSHERVEGPSARASSAPCAELPAPPLRAAWSAARRRPARRRTAGRAHRWFPSGSVLRLHDLLRPRIHFPHLRARRRRGRSNRRLPPPHQTSALESRGGLRAAHEAHPARHACG
jgi:hypothetical protein